MAVHEHGQAQEWALRQDDSCPLIKRLLWPGLVQALDTVLIETKYLHGIQQN